jgi:hypothetical protein
LDDSIPCLELQGQNLFELLKQHLRLKRIVTVALQPGHKRELRLDALIAIRDVLVGKLEMMADNVRVDCRIHGEQKRLTFEEVLTGERRAAGRPLRIRALERRPVELNRAGIRESGLT